jgi:hypothetical protein
MNPGSSSILNPRNRSLPPHVPHLAQAPSLGTPLNALGGLSKVGGGGIGLGYGLSAVHSALPAVNEEGVPNSGGFTAKTNRQALGLAPRFKKYSPDDHHGESSRSPVNLPAISSGVASNALTSGLYGRHKF